MKILKGLSVLIFLAILFSTSYAANVQWRETGGPFGSVNLDIIDIQVIPTGTQGEEIVYVLAEIASPTGAHVLLKSTDAGTTFDYIEESIDAWSYELDGTTYYYEMAGIAAHPSSTNIVYAYGGNSSNYYGGVWKSDNSGVNWDRIYPIGNHDGGYTTNFVIAPSNPQVLYRGLNHRYVHSGVTYKNNPFSVSINEGQSWTEIGSNEGIPQYFGVTDISVHPTNESIVAGTFCTWWMNDAYPVTTAEGGVYISTNEGNSFELSLAMHPGYQFLNPATYYRQPIPVDVEYDKNNPNNIRAIKPGGLWEAHYPDYAAYYTSPEAYESFDGGVTWATTEIEEMYHTEFENAAGVIVETDPNDFDTILYRQIRLWRSRDGGNSWTQINSRGTCFTFVSNEAGVVYLGDRFSPIFQKSTNFGDNWTDLSLSISERKSAQTVITNPLTFGRFYSRAVGLGVVQSKDYGDSYLASALGTGPGSLSKYRSSFDLQNENIAYSVQSRDIKKTTDGWDSNSTIYSLPYVTGEALRMIKASPVDGIKVYLTVAGGDYNTWRIMRSTDSGENWSTWGPTGSNEAPQFLAINPTTPEVMYKGGDIGNGQLFGIWKSTDEGQSWEDISDYSLYGSSMTTISAIAVNPVDNNIIYVGTGNNYYPGRVFISTDYGENWASAGIPPSDSYPSTVLIDPVRPERVYTLFYPTNESESSPKLYRRIHGAAEYWEKISDYFDTNDIWINEIDMEHSTDVIIYAATDNGVYIGIDYDGLPAPSIESVSPPLISNLTANLLDVEGRYFIDLTNVSITGPENDTLSHYTYTPDLVNPVIDPGLPPGTYEITAIGAGGTSNAGTFEVVGPVPGGPTIESVSFDNRPFEGSSSPISSTPLVRAVVKDINGLNEDGFEYLMKRVDTTDYRWTTLESTVFTTSEGGVPSGEVSFLVDPYIPSGKYVFTIVARDMLGNLGAWSGTVEVNVGDIRVIGEILTYPTPFAPLGGTNAIVAYNLNRDSDVEVLVYSTGGQIILTKIFSSGEDGGHAGYNQFEWNGSIDGGGIVGNGIYVIRIKSGNKEVGTGKIVIFE